MEYGHISERTAAASNFLSVSFHMFLDSENMAPAIVVTVLWFVVFSQVRSSFAGLFVAKKAGLKSSSRAEAPGAT